MTLLDLQSLEIAKNEAHGEVAGTSTASLLLCGDSSLSLVTC
ncbi:SapB/AmfS family lanthipeptide [Nocardiopsis sp. NPDC058631]